MDNLTLSQDSPPSQLQLQSHWHCRELTDLDSLADFVPQYRDTVAFQHTDVGIEQGDADRETCEWVNPPYEVDQLSAVARILSTIDNCVLIRTHQQNSLHFPHLCTAGFDGVIVGRLKPVPEERLADEILITSASNLQVLFAKALLIMQYEKEITDRVVHNAPPSAVNAVERKLNSMKREIESQLDRPESQLRITPTDDWLQAIAVGELDDPHSQLIQ